jgi:hypothetical protein
MGDGVRDLLTPLRLEVRQQFEPPLVVHPVTHPTQRHTS